MPEIRLGSRWFADDGREVLATQLRSAFPAPLGPGESEVVPVHVLAPEQPGQYRVEIDLIHEHVRWFGAGVSCAVLVEPRRRIAVMGGDEAVADIARLLETIPDLEPVALRPFGPSGQEGYAGAWGLRQYLLGDVPTRRVPFIATVVARTVRLGASVAAMRLGRKPSLPRYGGEFLTAVHGCDLLVFADLDAQPWSRELWRAAAAVYAARGLGVPVAVRRTAAGGFGLEQRLLTGLIGAAAVATFSDVTELQPFLERA